MVQSIAVLSLAVLLLALPSIAAEQGASEPTDDRNGFAFESVSVDRSEIRRGGRRDGIRAVDEAKFVAVEGADWVRDTDPVLGVAVGEEAHAYPVHLMEYHQIVNDTIGGEPIVATYDPIAGMPVAYSRKAGDRTLDFGVSGLVYRSNFLLYDRQTESLWSQYLGRAIAGPLAGTRLERVAIRQEPLAVWMSRHASTLVLERPYPTRIDYRHSPFSAYWGSPQVPFPVPHRDARFHPKEVVVGVEVGSERRAYLGSVLLANGSRIVDEIDGRKIRVAYDTNTATFQWDVPEDVRVTEAYWFAWKAFEPETSLWDPSGQASAGAEPAAD